MKRPEKGKAKDTQSLTRRKKIVYTWIPLAMTAGVTLMMFFLYRNIDKDMAKVKAENGIQD